MNIFSFNPCNNPVKEVLIASLYRWESWAQRLIPCPGSHGWLWHRQDSSSRSCSRYFPIHQRGDLSLDPQGPSCITQRRPWLQENDALGPVFPFLFSQWMDKRAEQRQAMEPAWQRQQAGRGGQLSHRGLGWPAHSFSSPWVCVCINQGPVCIPCVQLPYFCIY